MDKIKVGIDARTLSEKGGVRRYVINLINNLRNNGTIELFIFYNKKELKGTFAGCKEICLLPRSKYLLPIYDLFTLPIFCKMMKIDILHLPKSSCNFSKSIKKIVTLHDLIPVTHPKTENLLNRMYWRLHFWLAAKFANKIITASEFSKEQISSMYKIPKRKIKVIYHGVENSFKKENQKKINRIKEKYDINNKFFLFVGTIQPRKNIESCIKAISIVRKTRGIDVDLVVAGRKGWKTNSDLLNKSFVKILGFVPEEDLPILYSAAEGLLYVSLAEGFGFPIIEAQACGCPVITSDISSMPEIAGDGALLVNPYSVKEISEALEKLIKDKKLKNCLVGKGYKNVKRFSWEKTAQEFLKEINNLLIKETN